MNKKISTFDREMKNAKFKKIFEKSYKEFLLSELLLAMMEQSNKSVRNLAKEIGLSPTIIQSIRSGTQDDMKISNFVRMVDACGYSVILEGKNDRIQVKNTMKQGAASICFLMHKSI